MKTNRVILVAALLAALTCVTSCAPYITCETYRGSYGAQASPYKFKKNMKKYHRPVKDINRTTVKI